jgi:phosphoglycolate phosphatase
MALLNFGASPFDTDLVIFDKDGTLIDFAHAWSVKTEEWVDALVEAVRLADVLPEQALPAVRDSLFFSWGYDPVARRFAEQGPMITASLATLRTIAATVFYQHGIAWLPAELLAKEAALVTGTGNLSVEMFKTLADLPQLFGALKRAGVAVAVVTADDEMPTRRMLEMLGVAHLVDFVAGADSGFGEKPEPGGVLAACSTTGVKPTRAVVVGDSTTDMLMAARAGVGRRVALTSGMMPHAVLAPTADIVLGSIAEIAVPELALPENRL